MSTMTLDRGTSHDPNPAPPQSRREGPGLSRGVLRSEWLKLRSVRSTVLTLASAGGALLAFGLMFAAIVGGVLSAGGGDADSEFAGDPAGTTLAGSLLAQLIIGVMGVMFITSEYSTGSIRATLTAVPKRLPVLWAKAAVLTVATLPVMLASAFVAFFAGQALIGSGGLDTASLGDPGVLRAVLGTAVYLTGIALIGLAVGTLLRSTAAGIASLFGVIFLLPGLAGLVLPSGWGDTLLSFLPSNAGATFTTVNVSPELLTPGAGMAVFALWVIVPLAAAAVALRRRSA